jgi:hypothetical protein
LKSCIIKISWYWQKDRHLNEQNRIDSSDINSHIGQKFFVKDAKNTQLGKGRVQKIVLRNLNTHNAKEQTGHLFYTIHTNQLKMDKRLMCKA